MNLEAWGLACLVVILIVWALWRFRRGKRRIAGPQARVIPGRGSEFGGGRELARYAIELIQAGKTRSQIVQVLVYRGMENVNAEAVVDRFVTIAEDLRSKVETTPDGLAIPRLGRDDPDPFRTVTFGSGSGSSAVDAVVIGGVENEFLGVQSEYHYLDMKFGQRGTDWELDHQALIDQEGRQFDEMALRLPDGTRRSVFFDITAFYNKLG